MNIKAEFVHIAPVSLSSDFPLKKILDSASKIKKSELTFSEIHEIMAEFIPDFSENHSALFFTKAKLLFDPSIGDFSRQNLATSQLRKTAFKALIYLQLAKNRKDHNKGLPSTWNHNVNPDDSTFLNTSLKPIAALKLTIPNFLKDAALVAELAQPDFEAEFARVFFQPDVKTLALLVEKKNTVEIDFSEFYEVINLSSKVLTLDSVKKSKLFISECSNSNIYFRSSFDTVIITRCKNCEIFIPCVKRITLIEHSHDLSVSVVSRVVHISNVNDSIINVYSCFEPQLLGETINVVLGPFNANFVEVFDMMEAAELPLRPEHASFFASPLMFYTSQQFLDYKKNSFATLSPEQFETLILPKEFIPLQFSALILDKRFMILSKNIEELLKSVKDFSLVMPVLAPVKYKEMMIRRSENLRAMKKMIADHGLSKEQEAVFIDAVQGYFREWLITKPHSTAALIRTLNSFNPKF